MKRYVRINRHTAQRLCIDKLPAELTPEDVKEVHRGHTIERNHHWYRLRHAGEPDYVE